MAAMGLHLRLGRTTVLVLHGLYPCAMGNFRAEFPVCLFVGAWSSDPLAQEARTMKPLCIELFCGCFGWSAGWLEQGGYAAGFDLEHLPHHGPVPKGADMVIQDVLTLHGSQFREASLILASPPCQFFSYCAMPWSKAKKLAAEVRASPERTAKELALFDACFRIQREAIEAAGHFIPLVVENVRGAIPWVGRSRWNYGSFHLWGDVPALMPQTRGVLKAGVTHRSDGTTNFHQGQYGQKVPGFRFDGSGKSFQTASVEGVKCGGDWFNASQPSISRLTGSKSPARKAASAEIARIPFPLASYIARVYRPERSGV